MSSPKLFLDSSALVAGVASPSGAARALLILSEAGLIQIIVSEQVVVETERAIARKMPRALSHYRDALRSSGLQIVRDPSPAQIAEYHDVIAHEQDVPIVVAAMKAEVDYLVTFNRRHFIDDPAVASRAGLEIGTAGDALEWVRVRLSQGSS